MNTLNPPLSRAEWRFVLWWVLATIIGWAAGFYVCEGLKAFLLQLKTSAPDGLILGFFIGIAQIFALRGRIGSLGWWFLASTIGFAAGKAAGDALTQSIPGIFGAVLDGAIIGVVLGLVEWLIVRKYSTQAGWWVLATAIAWAVGWGIISTVDDAAGKPVATSYLIGGIGAAIAGVITGISLVLLLRRRT